MAQIPVTVTSHDIHPFDGALTGPIVLGGIEIPCEKKLKAHSDGDVVLHAIVDAVLGILAIPHKRDIGSLFPDNDPKWKDADSVIFVKEAFKLVKEQGTEIKHLNIQVACKTPRLSEYYEDMVEKISDICALPAKVINVQAMSNNGCDDAGQGKAISVLASVTALKEV